MQGFLLQPQSLSTALADKLRERILQRTWLPGTDLNEGEIAATYGVSRTPVREAMKLLAQEGLLQALPRRGMRIAILTPQQQQEALELAELLTQFIATQDAALEEPNLANTMLRMAQSRLHLAQPQN